MGGTEVTSTKNLMIMIIISYNIQSDVCILYAQCIIAGTIFFKSIMCGVQWTLGG